MIQFVVVGMVIFAVAIYFLCILAGLWRKRGYSPSKVSDSDHEPSPFTRSKAYGDKSKLKRTPKYKGDYEAWRHEHDEP